MIDNAVHCWKTFFRLTLWFVYEAFDLFYGPLKLFITLFFRVEKRNQKRNKHLFQPFFHFIKIYQQFIC